MSRGRWQRRRFVSRRARARKQNPRFQPLDDKANRMRNSRDPIPPSRRMCPHSLPLPRPREAEAAAPLRSVSNANARCSPDALRIVVHYRDAAARSKDNLVPVHAFVFYLTPGGTRRKKRQIIRAGCFAWTRRQVSCGAGCRLSILGWPAGPRGRPARWLPERGTIRRGARLPAFG